MSSEIQNNRFDHQRIGRGRSSLALFILSIAIGIFAASGLAIADPETKAAMQAGQTFRDCPDCPEMMVIPAGSIAIGSSDADTERDLQATSPDLPSDARPYMEHEHPQHEVVITKPFALAKFPVTKREFEAFVQDTGYAPDSGCALYQKNFRMLPDKTWRDPGFSQTDLDPVVCVSWDDANAYIAWLNKKVSATGDPANKAPYRLPSEAEWEYAGRAGTRTARWWGDSIGRNNADCNRCRSTWDKAGTAPVGSFQPNPFGLYDMLGNVAQWTEDCWNENYVGAPTDGAPWLAANCERRVARGGDWAAFPWLVRSATRLGLYATHRVNPTGFRIAKTL